MPPDLNQIDWASMPPEVQAQVMALMNAMYGTQGGGFGPIPEYSVSKGWQPTDIGTLQANLNYEQDFRSQMNDPFLSAANGYFNPSAGDPTVEYEQPEMPQLPKLTLYSRAAGTDDVKRAMLMRLSEGADPYQVALELEEQGLIPDRDGSTARFDATIKEAEALQSEIYAAEQYQMQVQNPQVKSEQESEWLKQFTDAGYSDPRAQYTDEQLVPELGPANQLAEQLSADMSYKRRQLDSVPARDALMKRVEQDRAAQTARQPQGGGREGWTNISQDGSRLEQMGAAINGSYGEILANPLRDVLSDPRGATMGGAQRGMQAAGRAGVRGLDWLVGRPNREEDAGPEPDKKLAEMAARLRADGGPGIAEKARGAFANFIQNNTKPHDSGKLQREISRSLGGYDDALWARAIQQERVNRERAAGRTPYRDEFYGRAGL